MWYITSILCRFADYQTMTIVQIFKQNLWRGCGMKHGKHNWVNGTWPSVYKFIKTLLGSFLIFFLLGMTSFLTCLIKRWAPKSAQIIDRFVWNVFFWLQDDVFLICSNAMQYNAPDTIYFRQVYGHKKFIVLQYCSLSSSLIIFMLCLLM